MIELAKRSNLELFIDGNIGVLEDALDQRARDFFENRKGRKKHDFGPKIRRRDLVGLATRVVNETKGFLDISENYRAKLDIFSTPEEIFYGSKIALLTGGIAMLGHLPGGLTVEDLVAIGFTGFVFGSGVVLTRRKMNSGVTEIKNNTIRLSGGRETRVVGELAHEYAHHLQHHLVELPFEPRTFAVLEGHARGVGGEVSRIFAERHDNPAYLDTFLEVSAIELNVAYLLACKRRGISPKDSLQRLPLPKFKWLFHSTTGRNYATGTAAMSIAETQYGKRVYRDVIKNDFSFLRTQQ